MDKHFNVWTIKLKYIRNMYKTQIIQNIKPLLNIMSQKQQLLNLGLSSLLISILFILIIYYFNKFIIDYMCLFCKNVPEIVETNEPDIDTTQIVLIVDDIPSTINEV